MTAHEQWLDAVGTLSPINLDEMAGAAFAEAERLKLVQMFLVESDLRPRVDAATVRLSEVHRRTALFLDQIAPHQREVIAKVRELQRKQTWGKR